MTHTFNRRQFARLGVASLTSAGMLPLLAATTEVLHKPVPSSGEMVPAIGLGSWITFNVGDDPVARRRCAAVMRHFFDAGGRVIDSSPMYGSSQPVIGEALAALGARSRVFSADKVWTSGDGARQIATSAAHWGLAQFDLLQVHNLLAWREQLPLLLALKRAGRLRYVGITTSEGRRHTEIEQVMRDYPIDFVQVSYNIVDRAVEQRILPLARDRGIAVIANRPFREGALIRAVARHRLPNWAGDIDCVNWPQFLLKYIVSHPDVCCAIPATSREDHVRENMGAARGRLPDADLRRRMASYVQGL